MVTIGDEVVDRCVGRASSTSKARKMEVDASFGRLAIWAFWAQGLFFFSH